MKKVFFLTCFLCAVLSMWAQQDETAKAYNNIQNTPAFKIYAVPDSTAFSSDQLKKDQPFVLIFFSPDCDHCQKETKELLAYKEELKNIQVVMTSPASFRDIKNFYQDYNIASMKNIVMGQDLNYALGLKYQLKTYPSIFVYDAKGKLAKAFVGNASIPAILDAVK